MEHGGIYVKTLLMPNLILWLFTMETIFMNIEVL